MALNLVIISTYCSAVQARSIYIFRLKREREATAAEALDIPTEDDPKVVHQDVKNLVVKGATPGTEVEGKKVGLSATIPKGSSIICPCQSRNIIHSRGQGTEPKNVDGSLSS